jgi:hypothetical protein
MGASVAIVAALLASPAILSTVSATPSTQPSNTALQIQAATTTTSTTSTQSGQHQQGRPGGQGGPGPGPFPVPPNQKGYGNGNGYRNAPPMTVGQTITITSTQGMFRTYSTPRQNGTASGTLTFTITGKLSQGYTLSLTSGTITVAGTTYTVASGTAQMGLAANAITGQGTTTPTGQFLIQAQARGSFAGTTASVALDLNGSTEYAVFLTGNITN